MCVCVCMCVCVYVCVFLCVCIYAECVRERDIKKGKIEEHLIIPTEQDVEEYVLNKSKELRMIETINPINLNLYDEVK